MGRGDVRMRRKEKRTRKKKREEQIRVLSSVQEKVSNVLVSGTRSGRRGTREQQTEGRLGRRQAVAEGRRAGREGRKEGRR